MANRFNEDVDKAIVKYKEEKNQDKKNKIFVEEIMPAFESIASYWYVKMPVAKNPEIKQDCLTDLFEKIEKFDTSRVRGFPYFNQIAKNFFSQQLKKEKKQINNNEYDIDLIDYLSSHDLLDVQNEEDIEKDMESIEFVQIFKENLVEWEHHFKKDQEKQLVGALIEILNQADRLDPYVPIEKKAVLHYIKELTNLNSKQITTNLAKIKKKFFALKRKYDRGDI